MAFVEDRKIHFEIGANWWYWLWRNYLHIFWSTFWETLPLPTESQRTKTRKLGGWAFHFCHESFFKLWEATQLHMVSFFGEGAGRRSCFSSRITWKYQENILTVLEVGTVLEGFTLCILHVPFHLLCYSK